MLALALAVWTALGALVLPTHALSLDVNSTESIKDAAATIAYDLMSLYPNNHTDTPPTDVGTFPQPLYWWEAGAVWGALIDYWAYTKDASYNPTVTQALLAQTGPNNNFMPPAYFSSLGNDDQAFWAIAALTAHEYHFPTPPGNKSTIWLDLAEAVFNTMVPRWHTNECNGGLQWQIFKSNPGWGYKNTISNGGFFQISARLAASTGNQTYVEWCEKIWDWLDGVGFIDSDYNVYDGASSSSNCTDKNKDLWTYNPAVILHGAATLYNHTHQAIWAKRASGLLTACSNAFFSPYRNATDIMYQPDCEPSNTCNDDEYSFKAYLSRWMAQAAHAMPSLKASVKKLLSASAEAAAESCSGDTNHTVCGEKWYVGGYDGSSGVGQSLSALETVQALLLLGD